MSAEESESLRPFLQSRYCQIEPVLLIGQLLSGD